MTYGHLSGRIVQQTKYAVLGIKNLVQRILFAFQLIFHLHFFFLHATDAGLPCHTGCMGFLYVRFF